MGLVTEIKVQLNKGTKKVIRNRSSTRNASARGRKGDRFVSRLNTASYLKTLKMFLLLLCQVRDISSKIRWNALTDKQVQLSTVHCQDSQTKVMQSCFSGEMTLLTAIICLKVRGKVQNLKRHQAPKRSFLLYCVFLSSMEQPKTCTRQSFLSQQSNPLRWLKVKYYFYFFILIMTPELIAKMHLKVFIKLFDLFAYPLMPGFKL